MWVCAIACARACACVVYVRDSNVVVCGAVVRVPSIDDGTEAEAGSDKTLSSAAAPETGG